MVKLAGSISSSSSSDVLLSSESGTTICGSSPLSSEQEARLRDVAAARAT